MSIPACNGQGGCLPWVCLPGGSAQGEVCPGGVSQYALGQTHTPVNRMTDRYKNLAATTLRTATKQQLIQRCWAQGLRVERLSFTAAYTVILLAKVRTTYYYWPASGVNIFKNKENDGTDSRLNVIRDLKL